MAEPDTVEQLPGKGHRVGGIYTWSEFKSNFFFRLKLACLVAAIAALCSALGAILDLERSMIAFMFGVAVWILLPIGGFVLLARYAIRQSRNTVEASVDPEMKDGK